EELQRVQRLLLSATIFGRESTYALADSIGRAVTLTDLDHLRKYLPRLMEVTPADIQRVAKKYLDPSRSVTAWSLPGAKGSTSSREDTGTGRVNARSRHGENAKEAAGGFDLKKAQRVELPNGLVLLLFENRRLPIVEVQVS